LIISLSISLLEDGHGSFFERRFALHVPRLFENGNVILEKK
jgi:hypothetical protein